MSLPAILKVAAEVGAVDLAVRGAKTIWGKMPWAQDARKRDAVDAAAERFLRDAEELVANVPEVEAERALGRLADGFQRHVADLGLSEVDAALVRSTLIEQIEQRAIRPLRRMRALENRVEELEAQEKQRRDTQAAHVNTLALAAKRAERAYIGLGLAIGLAISSMVLALVALLR
jgi:hypothetical protein